MAFPREVAFIGQIPILGPDGEEDRSDYRPVPPTDRGNEDYSDRGMLGSYTPTSEPYRAPRDVRWFTGYGASAADLDRGYIVPDIRDPPAYDLDDYKERYSQPMVADDAEEGHTNAIEEHWEFRSRNRRSRGFLTRPRIPTERG